MHIEDSNLATELLHEVKASAKRWFIIAIVELVAIVVLIFMLFVVPTDEYSIDQEADNGSYNQVIGGNYNGIEAESDIQETQSEKK